MKPYISIKLQLKALAVLLVLCSFMVNAESKIGFVDMQILIDSSPQIQKARATIDSEFNVQNQDIKQKESDLEMLESHITKDGSIMSSTELGKLQERARIIERQIRRAKEDLRDAITIRRNQVFNKIQQDLNKIVKQYAIKNGYDAILINEILYVSDKMDITQEILQVLKEKSQNDGN